MKRYEQTVILYGTVVVEAEDIAEAKGKIDSVIGCLPDNLSIEPLLIGDVETIDEIYEAEEEV